MTFKLTYSTMFDPPEELHQRFEAALAQVRELLGRRHRLHLAGRDVEGADWIANLSPIDGTVLGSFAVAGPDQVGEAIEAAKAAFPAWRATPLSERVRLSKRVAALIEERVYTIAAVLALEVGKNRMESLGEAQETADFFTGYAEDFARYGGFDRALADDPVTGPRSRNRSVLKPHGVWGVISPFNFPLALAGGPTAAALVTGNTVVLKGATDTPWAVRLLADCIRDAGYPPGVFNLVTGTGGGAGEALAGHPNLAGLTFTGSHAVGMELCRRMVSGRWPRPCIAEMGGKNACVVAASADLTRAVPGIVRSAFGLSGQKCSALSRVYVAEEIADRLIAEVCEATRRLTVGDPTRRENWMGPVINDRAVEHYLGYAGELARHGSRILVGGRRLTGAEHAHGKYVAPTIAVAPVGHPLFATEMFLPVLMIARVGDVAEAVARANESDLGLTAGCFGSPPDVEYFLEHIEAGTVYVNRPQGATTGAWPWYQAFSGWKGSGSTGKAIGSFHYLPQYLREQSQTVVE
ncbi:MAG: aldehyde dehydrogenase family protein [Gammaproteobacteria bacterium]|nr:aldehyde dehydrogenase family protein [Gammaproteobacteria bacterium]